MTRGTGWLVGIALAWLAATSAHAQTAGVVASGGSPEVVAADWDAAVTGARTELEREGYLVRDEHVLAHGASEDGCVEAACLESQRASMGVEVLAVVIVWGGTSVHDRAAHVVTSLVTADASYDATVEVENGDVALAARRGVIEARERMARGDRPWLRVRGNPAGAMVVIDGVETGVLPWEGAVSAGMHRVEVRLSGYVGSTREVQVGTEAVDVDVALVREGAVGGPDLPWVVTGAVSAVGGAAMLVAAVIGATTHACTASCAGGTPDMRTLNVPNEAAVVAWSVTGAALIVFGAIALGVGLASSGASSQPVSVRPDGLVVRF